MQCSRWLCCSCHINAMSNCAPGETSLRSCTFRHVVFWTARVQSKRGWCQMPSHVWVRSGRASDNAQANRQRRSELEPPAMRRGASDSYREGLSLCVAFLAFRAVSTFPSYWHCSLFAHALSSGGGVCARPRFRPHAWTSGPASKLLLVGGRRCCSISKTALGGSRRHTCIC